MKAFKKPVTVHYGWITQPIVVQTLEGPVNAGPEQVLMTGVKGEQDPIGLDYFLGHYDAKPDGTCVKRKVIVDAVQLTEPKSVKVSWSNDLLHGKPGDYHVVYEPGNEAIVEKTIFEETYEVIPL